MNTLARFGLLACLSTAAFATRSNADEVFPVISKEDLAARYPGLSVEQIRESPIAGLYEVAEGQTISYVSLDGRFMIHGGDVINLDTRTNLTEARRAEDRAAILAAIDPSTEIVFSPPDGNAKYRVTVFTDVDCGYCRQFHRSIAQVNALGIEVRYVSYPRSGPDTESGAKAVAVWCAPDRNAALTRAKLGGEVPAAPDCGSTPIAEEFELCTRVGLKGTPGVYSESGEELGGYLEPAALLAKLERLQNP